MRIAIFGAGAVGGYFGGRLAEAGHSVVFIARGAHLDAICRDGLHVESRAGNFAIHPCEATDAPGSCQQVEAVLVCVKAWHVPEAASAMLPLLGSRSFVVPLLNGVEAADQLAAVVGGERVLGGLCRVVCYVTAPGRIRHAGLKPTIEFGERDGRRTERSAALRAAFADAVGVAVLIPDNIEAALWEKFLFIAPFGGVGALKGAPAGTIRQVPENREMLAAAMAEVFHVARARGVPLAADCIARSLAFVDSLPEGTTSSMQRDILEGRPSELESQNGAVVRLGRAAGVPTPVNESIYRSLLPAEQRARGLTAPPNAI